MFRIPLDRDGVIRCAWDTIAFHRREMMRLRRSTAQAEADLCDAAELCLYCQIVITEVLVGSYKIRFLQDVSALPLLSPFKTDSSRSSIYGRSVSIFSASVGWIQIAVFERWINIR